METGISRLGIFSIMDGRVDFTDQLRSRLDGGRKELFDFICKGLMDLNRHYNWVGIYILKGAKLVLDAYAGEKTEHDIISLGDGLCSQAIVTNAIVNVSDVRGNTDYLACFPSTRSELVVPIRLGSKPIGEIDVDSDTNAAFTKDDEEFLSLVADLISGRVNEVSED